MATDMKNIITEKRLELCRADRYAMREKHYAAVREAYGDGITKALRDLYNLYDESNYIWLAGELRDVIKKNAAKLLYITAAKVAPCKKEDGGFSYFYDRGCVVSQGAPVGLDVPESDVNASTICSKGVVNPICSLLEIPQIPIFGVEDSRLFYELIENAEVKPKTVPKPDWFESKLA